MDRELRKIPRMPQAGHNAFEFERRGSRRFALTVPVLFSWNDQSGKHTQRGGFTRDVSTLGTYVTCDGPCPEMSSQVEIEVLLPSMDVKPVGLKLKSSAKVVRMGGEGEGRGFALATDFAADEDPETGLPASVKAVSAVGDKSE